MKIDLDGKHIVVTGGSLGIGKATAQECLAYGATVTICARGADSLEDARRELAAPFGDRICAIRADVSNFESVRSLFTQSQERFGTIHGVVHAAAVYGPIGAIDSVNAEQWRESIEINLIGTFAVIQQSCLAFKTSGGGRLVLFSGGGAATPFPNYTAYASSKAAVVRLTETVAAEMAQFNIEVNCVAPGMVATRLHEQTLAAGERAGLDFLKKTQAALEGAAVPATVGARCAAYLVSDAARGITGKFVAAPYDSYETWLEHREALTGDVFTLRRIVPRDRGMDWQ